jgi:hypothetical protein
VWAEQEQTVVGSEQQERAMANHLLDFQVKDEVQELEKVPWLTTLEKMSESEIFQYPEACVAMQSHLNASKSPMAPQQD